MKNARILNIFALVCNLLIIGVVVYAMVGTMGNDIVANLKFYRVDAALLLALASLVSIPANIACASRKQKLPKALYVLKLVTTTAVMVSLLASIVLAIVGGVSIATMFGNFSFTNNAFLLSFVLPIFAFLTTMFFDASEKAKFPVNFLSLLPIALYGVFYVINHYAKFIAEGADWYGVTAKGDGLAYGLLAAFVAIALVVSIIIWAINHALTKAYFKSELKRSTTGPVKNVVVFDELPVKHEEPVQDEEDEEESEELEQEQPQEEVKEEVQQEAQEEDSEQPEEEEDNHSEPEENEVLEETAEFEETPIEEDITEEEATEEVQEEQPQEEEQPVEETSNEEQVEEKPEEKKKTAPKKKPQTKKKEEKPAEKPEEKKKPAPKEQNGTKVYHLTKRKEDGMWAITFVGGQKAVKLFKTKKEAEEYLATLTKNQGATALIRNSKGAKAGKFASSIKAEKEEK